MRYASGLQYGGATLWYGASRYVPLGMIRRTNIFIYLRWDMVSGPLSGKLKDYRAWRPLQHVVEIIRTLLSGRISQDILKHLLILAAYAGLAISCAIWRLRRRLPLLIKTVGS